MVRPARSRSGQAFTAELAKVVSAIREHPLQFTCVRGETRRVILKRFPYAVYFRVTEAEVIVLAVHGRQAIASLAAVSLVLADGLAADDAERLRAAGVTVRARGAL